MIGNARVLREEHIPRAVPHRNAEKNELSRALQPIEDGEPGEKATFLFGPSGAGKTCLSKFMLRELREEVLDVETKYINCWNDYSRFRALYEVLDGFTSTVDIHRQSTPTDELLNRVRNYEGVPYVIVLDEVDQLEDKKVLYDLYQVEKISLVLIANREEELFHQLDDRLTSRLHGSRRINLEKYHLDQLIDILDDRVEYGLVGEPISRTELEQIADVAAGDAREAIAILRNAAREAAQREMDSITEEVIREVTPEARHEIHRDTVDNLREHQRVVYEIIIEAGEISPGEIFERYEQAVDDPRTERTVRNYLSKMQHYDIIEGKGQKRSRVYQPKQTPP